MKQKVIKVGNSLAVTLPASYVREYNIKPGDIIDIPMVKENPSSYSPEKKLTPEFKKWLNDFTHKYHDLLKELAKTP
ncbi:MAG TPA: AbrB/MazE/SpoVT family DNA-binding domain-containing protein [Candidatus Nitrosocosmicus sp.]|nr:AbrB/MazE/SpoVT family DNA-binding domain-containing protein [Candidatus Nitrosocosmicus sp.]